MKKQTQEFKIELPAGIQGELSFAQFCEFCDHFGCDLLGKTRSGNWIIETDEIMNIYWLGANMAFSYNSPMTVSYLEKIKQRNTHEKSTHKTAHTSPR